MVTGKLRKLENIHNSPIDYYIPFENEKIHLNDFIGKNITLEFSGNIYCIDTGKKIKKSYGQGYSWESFMTLPQCDTCIIKPELCHYAQGTCRDDEWGETHCMQPHVIYLANSSKLKVGITRKKNVPFRWMDQGAIEALPILEVKDRKTSGMIEIEIAKEIGDKTNWRKMLKNDNDKVDLLAKRELVYTRFAKIIEKYKATKIESDIYTFDYPVDLYPEKVSSLSFDKTPIISGKLMGIKGQYLLLDTGVLNIRKHQGYEICLK
jgi:hypothetical protein